VLKAKGEAVQQAPKASQDRSLADRTNLQEDVVVEGDTAIVDSEQPLLEIPPQGSSGSGDAGAVVRATLIACTGNSLPLLIGNSSIEKPDDPQ
jgi:hypothetical protein